jgi:hypothetical protein
MSLQIRRGTEAQRNTSTFVPLSGEPIWTTDEKKLYVGDGVTAGGIAVSGGGGGAASDQALYTTSSVTFANLTATNNISATNISASNNISATNISASNNINGSNFNASNIAITNTATIGDIAGTNLSGVPTVRILDVLAVGGGTGPGSITSRGERNLIITPGGNQLGGKLAVISGESSGVVIGNHNDANIADFNTGTIAFNRGLNIFGANSNLAVAGGQLTLGNGSNGCKLETFTATNITSTATAQIAYYDTFAGAASAKFLVQIKDSGDIHFQEISLISDGTDVWKVEYGANTNNGVLGTFSADMNGSLATLYFTPTAPTSMNIKTLVTAL